MRMTWVSYQDPFLAVATKTMQFTAINKLIDASTTDGTPLMISN